MEKRYRIYKRLVCGMMAVMLAATVMFAARQTIRRTSGSSVEKKGFCVVIDAGHGGDDPGKVGINGALEKDINLEIAMQVKEFLEEEDVTVVLTREDENALHEEGNGSKKVRDMKKRIEIIEKTMPDLTVSIHQNSYHEEYVKGAQVFYYTDSADGKQTADILQKSLIERVDPENKREAKANDSYYLLKKTTTPIVIVECGFLSNREEAEKLKSKAYQEKVAWAVSMGILQSLHTK